MKQSAVAIAVDNVTQRFRVIHERPDSLRELFTRFFRNNAQFHDFEAVSKVSFTVGKGEMVGIVGRNGSGKSTLLKIIAGVYRPTSGRVTVNGTIAPLIELGAGMHSELTGRENILINGLLMGYSKAEMKEREERIIDFSEIGEFIDVPIKQYSSGMYMRLAFSVATEVDPEILILDEILAVGDLPFQNKCFDRLRAFRASGKTILLVTHSMGNIVDFCDRAILMDHGRMMLDGSPKEVVEAFEAASLPHKHELVEAETS
ncbi:MAG: ABC transporter ATP-binding protein [Acidobacteriaceae bacterium]|nr:ABC transporter ATP-binding protein [Acidobacteriaceae bacterium]